MATIPNPQNIERRTPRVGGGTAYLDYQPVDSGIARGLENVGNDAMEYALQEKARMDRVIVDNAQNKYLTKTIELENEYSQIKGESAVTQDIVKTYSTKLQGISDEISKEFKNQSQSDAWNKFYNADKVRFAANVMKHKMVESDRFSEETYKATNATRIQYAQTNWSDSKVVDKTATDIVNNVAREKMRAGWGDERTQLELQTNLGQLWGGVIIGHVNAKQYTRAKELLAQHQDTIGIDNATQISNAIKRGEKVDLSQQHFNEIIATETDPQKQFAMARKIGGEVGDSTLARLKEYEQEQRIFENEKQEKDNKFRLDQERKERKNITDLYINGEYIEAYRALQAAQYIDDKTVLGDKISKFSSGNIKPTDYDPQTYITLTNMIDDAEPGEVTVDDIDMYVGKGKEGGITVTQRDRLAKKLEKVNDEWKESRKLVLKNFERDRKDGFFGGGQDGDVEYVKQVQAFDDWSEKYPDKNPLDYYQLISSSKKVGSFLGMFPRYNTAKETRESLESEMNMPGQQERGKIEKLIPDEQKQAIIKALKDAGYPQTEANIRHVYETNK